MPPSSEPPSASWRTAFIQSLREERFAEPLKTSSLSGTLKEWTQALTATCVSTCKALGWNASAKGHPAQILPVSRGEYMALDVMAFPDAQHRWRFPVAVFELENSRRDDVIAYALWKVLCVRSDLRIVFCYRQSSEEGSRLVRHLEEHVVRAMALDARIGLHGETLVVVGTRGEAETFPYGFFKWWALDTGTGAFHLL